MSGQSSRGKGSSGDKVIRKGKGRSIGMWKKKDKRSSQDKRSSRHKKVAQEAGSQ